MLATRPLQSESARKWRVPWRQRLKSTGIAMWKLPEGPPILAYSCYTGGIFIGGGIAAKIVPKMKEPVFMQSSWIKASWKCG